MRDHPPPAVGGLGLVGSESLLLGLLEREGGVQVLAHDSVLELCRLVEHVDQRLSVFDHERRLVVCLTATDGDEMCESPVSSEMDSGIGHSDCAPVSGWDRPAELTANR